MSSLPIVNLDLLHKWKDAVILRMGFARLGVTLHRYSVQPYHITALGTASSAVSVWALFGYPGVFNAAMIIAMLCDAIDGWYARYLKHETTQGELLDHGIDFLVGLALLVKSYLYFGELWILAICILFVLEMAVIVLFRLQKDIVPPKIFVAFYFFGAYRLGLIIEPIYSIIMFILYIVLRQTRSFSKRNILE